MRLLLLFVLALGLAAAMPQERLRGSRRFSIATPGLLPGIRGRASIGQDEEAPVITEQAEETPSDLEPKRNRVRFSPRMRGKINPQAGPSQTPANDEEAAIQEAPSEDPSSHRADGLRLRRPIKKVTTTTTTTITTSTTTTTSAPETEPVVEKAKEELRVQEPEKSMPEKLPKEEMAKTEVEQVSKPESPEPEIVPDDPKVKASKGLPRPKLRPIPIKIGGRGGVSKAVEEQLAEPETPQDQESTPSEGSAVSSHRFSSQRRGPRIQGRVRGSRGRQAEAAPNQEQTETANQQAETGAQQPRARVQDTPKRFSRISPRRRTSAAAPVETPAEEPQNAEEAPAAEEPQRRFPNLKELKTIIADDKNMKPNLKLRRRKIGHPHFQRPFSSSEQVLPKNETHKNVEAKKRINEDPLTSLLLAPLSEDVQKNQQKRMKLQNDTPVEAPTQVPTTPRGSVKVPALFQTTVLTPIEIPAPIPARIALSRSRHPAPSNKESDRGYRGSDSLTRLIGTVEDTPPHEVRQILSGLGSRRRGLSRSNVTVDTRDRFMDDPAPAASAHQVERPLSDVDYLYDYYDYLMDEEMLQ